MVYIKEKIDDLISVIELKNNDIIVDVTNYGCTILNIIVNDKYNNPTDVVLGFPTVKDYMKKDGTYLGALVGRVANRIGNGRFILNNKEYNLFLNNGPNSLHGGKEGFSYKIFDYELLNDAVRFHYISEDGEENYPGRLDFYATYSIEKNNLKIEYEAITDQDTIVNVTNHSYFNLNGKPSNIENHIMFIQAQKVGSIDKNGLFNGKFFDVENTPFDYRKPTLIKNLIYKDNEQLNIGRGYDHTFLFDNNENQVQLYSSMTGIALTVSTTLPEAQIYSANYLNNQLSKDGLRFKPRDAICIETQYEPDSINKEINPKVILKKGETYHAITLYKFEVKK